MAPSPSEEPHDPDTAPPPAATRDPDTPATAGPRHAGGQEPAPRRRPRRRVTTEPAPGSDPTPQKEPPRHSEHENDERLKRDTPPHWGYRF